MDICFHLLEFLGKATLGDLDVALGDIFSTPADPIRCEMCKYSISKSELFELLKLAALQRMNVVDNKTTTYLRAKKDGLVTKPWKITEKGKLR